MKFTRRPLLPHLTFALVAVSSLILIYQNCTQTRITTAESKIGGDQNNGTGYTGKITYTALDTCSTSATDYAVEVEVSADVQFFPRTARLKIENCQPTDRSLNIGTDLELATNLLSATYGTRVLAQTSSSVVPNGVVMSCAYNQTSITIHDLNSTTVPPSAVATVFQADAQGPFVSSPLNVSSNSGAWTYLQLDGQVLTLSETSDGSGNYPFQVQVRVYLQNGSRTAVIETGSAACFSY